MHSAKEYHNTRNNLLIFEQAKAIRQRAADKENDETGGTIRMTRAKAAALAGPDDLVNAGIAKKPLQTNKSALNSNAAPTLKKRAALGDKSNVTKIENVDVKEGKKAYAARATLVSKTTSTTQNAGVQKLSRTSSSRSILGTKDNNKKTAVKDLKRPASGSGVMGGAAKKRNSGAIASQQSLKEPTPAKENEPPNRKSFAVEVEQRVHVEKKEVIKVEEPKPVIEDVKQAFEEGVLDLDAEDMDDPLMVAEYVVEIFEYLQSIEESTMPNPNYMDHQEHLEWKLRGVLVDWLIEVHQRFHLLPETLFLAINIIDRFLSTKIVQLDKLQLVGVTAMFIAAKYEEVLSPHVQNFRHVADDGFTEAEILAAERFVLGALNYDLSYPNPMNFLRRISKADSYEIQTRTLGKYFLEISLVDHRFLEYQPSHIAAASMYLARLILERGEWVSYPFRHCVTQSNMFCRMQLWPTMQVTLRKRFSRCLSS